MVVYAAVQFICSRLEHHVRKPASEAAVLCVERILYDAELTHLLNRWRDFADSAASNAPFAGRAAVDVCLGVANRRAARLRRK